MRCIDEEGQHQQDHCMRRNSFGKSEIVLYHFEFSMRIPSKITGHVAGEIVTRVFGQIHDAISKALHKNDIDIVPISFYELVTTITESQELWNEYCSTLRKNHIVTNLASKEHLFIFIEENREYIEHQYIFLKSLKNVQVESSLKKNKSDYFGSAKGLCNMILKSCKDEITSNTDQKRIYTLKKQVEGNYGAQEIAPLETRDKSFKILGNAFQDKKVVKYQNRWGLRK